MRDRVAEHVLQRRGHALQHAAVEFALRAVQLQLRLLAGLAGGLADDAAQAWHQALERHHARAHEAFLQVRAHPRLLQQQGFVLAGQVFHRPVQGLQVGRGFAKGARQLLQGAEPVEFQRIEGLVAGRAFALVAGDDLRFRFRVEAAQLVAQTDVGLLHFLRGAAERRQLLFQARAVDRHFAGVVHQAVEQVGADAHLLLRRADTDVVVVAEAVLHHRRGQRLEFDLRCRRRHEHQPVVDRFHDRRDRGFRARVQLVDQANRQADGATRGDAGDHSVQAVEATLEQGHAIAAEFGTLRHHRFQQGLHRVTEFADRHDAGHAGATLQGVQVALQADHRLAILGRVAQQRQQAIGMVEQVAAFLHEDVDQLRVKPIHVEGFIRIFGGCRGRQ